MAQSFERIVPELVVAHNFEKVTFSYTERDVALYALGVGACGADAVDEKELKYVHHLNGLSYIQVLPTFAVLFPHDISSTLPTVTGLHFNPATLLHGQQYLEIYKPLPTQCHIENKAFISGLHDKGKAAIVDIETISSNKETGEVLCRNRSTIYLRGAGGFSNAKNPYSYSSPTSMTKAPSVSIPSVSPNAVYEDTTKEFQALIYRLSGDYNPLHSDPDFAQLAGFHRPILHGLCTLGFAVRAVIKCCCDGDQNAVRSIFGRFLLHVFPGETLVTKMWRREKRTVFETGVKERQKAVLVGAVDTNHILSSL